MNEAQKQYYILLGELYAEIKNLNCSKNTSPQDKEKAIAYMIKKFYNIYNEEMGIKSIEEVMNELDEIEKKSNLRTQLNKEPDER